VGIGEWGVGKSEERGREKRGDWKKGKAKRGEKWESGRVGEGESDKVI
jgi:hypothetical protein